jgi:D-glycero-alpha-D-manno-heptose-7-phosphate kinase
LNLMIRKKRINNLTIASAPMRLSFLGGGTDFPGYFRNSGEVGRVFGCSIDKYVYVLATKQPAFEENRFKFTYRLTEEVNHLENFSHPVVREALKLLEWNTPINLATMASLPGRSGMGSSSAFTVALVALLKKRKHSEIENVEIAEIAIKIERELLNESGGFQDQYHAAIGGTRLYEFTEEKVSYSANLSDYDFVSQLSESLFILPIGGQRKSSEFAKKTENSISKDATIPLLRQLSNLTSEVYLRVKSELDPEKAIRSLADGMREGWEIKKKISGSTADSLQETLNFGIQNGAIAGKLCGAGGSGFAAFIVPAASRLKFQNSYREDQLTKINIVNRGVETHEI